MLTSTSQVFDFLACKTGDPYRAQLAVQTLQDAAEEYFERHPDAKSFRPRIAGALIVLGRGK